MAGMERISRWVCTRLLPRAEDEWGLRLYVGVRACVRACVRAYAGDGCRMWACVRVSDGAHMYLFVRAINTQLFN